jgi:hypothetical protein
MASEQKKQQLQNTIQFLTNLYGLMTEVGGTGLLACKKAREMLEGSTMGTSISMYPEAVGLMRSGTQALREMRKAGRFAMQLAAELEDEVEDFNRSQTKQ